DYYRLVARFGLTAIVASAAVGFGCAQERDTINKVDAYALDKSFFVGPKLNDPSDDPEFYGATTIVDVPFAVTPGVPPTPLRRVKWELTNEVLNARLTYESTNGVDGQGNAHTNSGQIVASFKVLSHFDIRRDYNPQTGEELNVIVENTTDRPWQERQYFRVD